MYLQEHFPQSNFFPLGFRSADTDEFFRQDRKRNDSIPNQKRELFLPDEIEPLRKENRGLSPEANAIIGENGKRRFDEFKKYKNNWYGGKGKELSKWSVSNFERFVGKIPELKSVSPSLFLTLEGNLQLGWEDRDGQSVEIEFYPDKIESFIESLAEENTVSLSDIFEFTEKIRNTLI